MNALVNHFDTYQAEVGEIDPSLFIDQIEYEQYMHELGEQKAKAAVERHVKNGNEADTLYGKSLINQFIPRVAACIKELISNTKKNKKLSQGRASNVSRLIPLLKSFGDVEAVAAIALRNAISAMTKRERDSATRVAMGIGRQVIHEASFKDIKANQAKDVQWFRNALDKKTSYIKKQETLSYLIREHVKEKPAVSEALMDDDYLLEIGMNLLHFVSAGTKNHIALLDIVTVEKGHKVTKKVVSMSDQLAERINSMKESLFKVAVQFKPMKIKPMPWKVRPTRHAIPKRDGKGRFIKVDGKNVFHNPLRMSGGYISDFVKPVELCKTRNRAQKAAIDSAEMDTFLAGLNAAQDTPWRVNKRMLALQTQLFDMDTDWVHDLGIAPAGKAEEPKRPWDVDSNKESLKQYKRSMAEWYNENIERVGLRANYKMMLDTARELEDASEFFNIWQADSRSRGYALGALHCQGADPMKAMIEFAEGKPITKENDYWLKLQVANLVADDPWTGENIDKLHLDERVAWVDANTERLLAVGNDPLADMTWTEFDKPFLGLTAVWDLAGYIEEGEGYLSHIAVALDGSCSGLQILGSAFRCEKTAAVVNLVPNNKPADIYSIVADMVWQELKEAVGGKTRQEVEAEALKVAKELAIEENIEWNRAVNDITSDDHEISKDSRKVRNAYWAHVEKFTLLEYMNKAGRNGRRKLVKRSVMTYAYSSKEFGFRQQVMEDTMLPKLKEAEAKIKKGEAHSLQEAGFPFHQRGNHAAGVLAKLTYQKVQEAVVKAGEAMNWMSECAKLISKEERPVCWTTPIGFPVVQDYKKSKDSVVDLVISGRKYQRFQMTMRQETDKADANKSSSAIAPNVVHSLDASLMWLVVANAKAEGINSFALIHDSFGTHVADTPRFFEIIRESLIQLFEAEDFFKGLEDEFNSQLPEEKREAMPSKPSYGSLDLSLVKDALHAFA